MSRAYNARKKRRLQARRAGEVEPRRGKKPKVRDVVPAGVDGPSRIERMRRFGGR